MCPLSGLEKDWPNKMALLVIVKHQDRDPGVFSTETPILLLSCVQNFCKIDLNLWNSGTDQYKTEKYRFKKLPFLSQKIFQFSVSKLRPCFHGPCYTDSECLFEAFVFDQYCCFWFICSKHFFKSPYFQRILRLQDWNWPFFLCYLFVHCEMLGTSLYTVSCTDV